MKSNAKSGTKMEDGKPKYLHWTIVVVLFLILSYLFVKYLCPGYPPPAY